MCGRYALTAPAQTLAETFDLDLQGFRVEARYNLAPGQWLVLVRPDGQGGRSLGVARWGLVPSWAKDPGSGPRPINARAEGLAEKPTFRGALRHGRCLIPASGFFEWQGAGKAKQPFYIQPAEGGLLAFAGLASYWSGFDGDVETCAIVTTAPNAVMAPIHDRMPAILPPEAWRSWLDPATPVTQALALLRPSPAEGLRAHPVSPRVGRVDQDDPGLVWPEAPLTLF